MDAPNQRKTYSLFNDIEDAEWKPKGLNVVYDALASGQIRPNIDRVFKMEEFPEA